MAATSNGSELTPHNQEVPLHLFVYGTLKPGEPNEHVLLRAGGPGACFYVARARTVERYPLVISSQANIPFLLNRPGLGHQIEGHVALIRTREALALLDDFEACPGLYRRLPVAVELLGALEKPGSDPADPLKGEPMLPPSGTATCQMYAYCGPDKHLLGLPHLADYRSNGEHGLPYLAERDDVRSEDQLG